MDNQFLRTEMLLGPQNMAVLKSSHVAVFGIGGVGAYASEALARSGVYNLTLIDHDTIEPSNINRQVHAGFKTVGRFKTDVMKDRILDINPEAVVHTRETFVLPDNIADIFMKWDYIVDALDTVSAKIAIAEAAWRLKIPVISAMGTGNKLYADKLTLDDIFNTQMCPLAKVMRGELKKRGIPRLQVCYSTELPLKPVYTLYKDSGNGGRKKQTPGSMSFVPPVAGFMMAGEVVRRLCRINIDEAL